MMTPQPPPLFNVHGMRVGCTPYHAIVEGTLECFFDPVCLNITAQWISTLPHIDWPKPLNSSMPSRFFPNTSTRDIFNQQMVEQWYTVKNFPAYYTACAPVKCTYTFSQRNDFLYVIITIIGLFGSLGVAMRIVSPLIIKFGRYIHLRFTNRNQPRPAPQQPEPGIVSKNFY